MLYCLEPLDELVFLLPGHSYELLQVVPTLDRQLQPTGLMGSVLMSSNLPVSLNFPLTQSLLPYIGNATSPVKI